MRDRSASRTCCIRSPTCPYDGRTPDYSTRPFASSRSSRSTTRPKRRAKYCRPRARAWERRLPGATKTASSAHSSDGSSDPSSLGSTTRHARDATHQPLPLASHHHSLTNKPAAPTRSRLTNARTRAARTTSASHDTTTHSSFCKPAKVDAASGPIASACSAALSGQEYAGCGTQRTTSGPKSTLCTASDGSTSTPAKRHGTSPGYTLMVRYFLHIHLHLLTEFSGWGKKLSYCIAFSADGAMDVTRRYVRDAKHAAERNRAPEAVLLHIMDEIRATRRANMSKQDKFRLQGEDIREAKELRASVISSIAHAVSKLRPEDIINAQVTRRLDPDAQKALEGRMSGNAQWIRARGEGGQQQNQQDPRNQHPR